MPTNNACKVQTLDLDLVPLDFGPRFRIQDLPTTATRLGFYYSYSPRAIYDIEFAAPRNELRGVIVCRVEELPVPAAGWVMEKEPRCHWVVGIHV